MFHPLAIEIDNVERAIRAGGEIDGVKPRIGGGEELLALLDPPRDERGAARLQHPAMNQVAERLSNKRVTAITGGQRIAPVNRETGESVEVARRFLIESLGGWRNREDF